ncbi:hypothetical protein [Siccirubricoccus sp. G192]|uniref:hypothetical protein n=1 Tax=Siccirubricoccus sp. G192 TaxID=2849651 RepID=UPI0020C2C4B9|nr:hypothetical protein [Siccirubricoccus sp. G192]
MPGQPGPPRGPIARLGTALAFAGGLVLLATALLTTTSVVKRWLTSQPVPGGFRAGLARLRPRGAGLPRPWHTDADQHHRR